MSETAVAGAEVVTEVVAGSTGSGVVLTSTTRLLFSASPAHIYDHKTYATSARIHAHFIIIIFFAFGLSLSSTHTLKLGVYNHVAVWFHQLIKLSCRTHAANAYTA